MRDGILHEQAADRDAGVRGERRAGVEAEGAAGDHDAVGAEVLVVACVGNLVDVVAVDAGLARHASARHASRAGADARLVVGCIRTQQRDARQGRAADFGRERRDLRHRGIGHAKDRLVLFEGFGSLQLFFG